MDTEKAIEAGGAAEPTDDPILRSYQAALQAAYGDALDRIVLFGSRARGEATNESDYDVAVFLKSLPDRWAVFDDLADLRTRFLLDTGAFFDAFPYPSAAYAEHTPLMQQIRRDGLTL